MCVVQRQAEEVEGVVGLPGPLQETEGETGTDHIWTPTQDWVGWYAYTTLTSILYGMYRSPTMAASNSWSYTRTANMQSQETTLSSVQ